ncbi:MAG TPA: HD domain-containing protein [Methanomassiliicoccales archaeon]|nr:HD domain-containing protein [Methanomassiliicoccales archaeon]
MRKTIKINELKAGGTVDDLFAVRFKKPVSPYKNGFTFHMWVSDAGGDMAVKYWGERDEKGVKALHDSIAKGSVVHVKGKVTEYNNALEIHVNPSSGDSVEVLKEGEYEMADFVASSSEDVEQMRSQLFTIMRKVKDAHLKQLLESFFGDEGFVKQFCLCPAAITHHSNYIGGLLEHTLRVAKTCEHYSQLYPELDRDLLITGAILHDIGKLREYTVSSIIGATDEGRLVGHLVIGAGMVNDAVRLLGDFPPELNIKVQHLVLSSHGTTEFGSPKEPLFPEAVALAMADLSTTRIEDMVMVKKTANTEDDWVQDKNLGSVYLK